MWANAQHDDRPAKYRWRPLRKLCNSIPCTRVVQQVPGLVLYFTQQQTHKNYNNVISQHTFPAVQYNLPSAQQVT